jgi:alpha-tubulin suppressor-like RCC1 family protein
LYTWGASEYGALGHGSIKSIPISDPLKVAFKDNILVKDVVVGMYHTLALTTDNRIFSFGCGNFSTGKRMISPIEGAVGHGPITLVSTPKEITSIPEKIAEICSGSCHSLVRTISNQLYTWGRGNYGVLGGNNSKSSMVPIKVSGYEDIIKDDPENNIPVRIDAARNFSAVLTKKGELYVWGKNEDGQLGIEDDSVSIYDCQTSPALLEFPDDEKVVKYAVGYDTLIAETESGKLYKCGRKLNFTPKSLYMTGVSGKVEKLICGEGYHAFTTDDGLLHIDGKMIYSKNKPDPVNGRIVIDMKEGFGGKISTISGKTSNIAAIIE